jgi:hypothetical protein
MRLAPDDLEAALLGGAFLGGGGGGSVAIGREMGCAAMAAGGPELLPIDALDDSAMVATVALVGSPASRQAEVVPSDYVRACELLIAEMASPLAGLITCENGAAATVNGWLQAAHLAIPVIDAPANGRAHPTSDIGGLQLEQVAGFESVQAACGGSRARGAYLERQVRGSLPTANREVRAVADQAGGLVAVARNPVAAAYLAKHAAVGAIGQAIELGKRLQRVAGRGARPVTEAAAEVLGAAVLVGSGRVESLDLRTAGGFDSGSVRVGGLELTIWNEYMTLESSGQRLATFPDLIVTLDLQTGMTVTSAELWEGAVVAVVVVPAGALPLAPAALDPVHLVVIERVTGKDVLPYARPTC